MKPLKETITLLPSAGTKAVTELAHITPAIINNIMKDAGLDEELLQAEIRAQAYTSMLSEFDAEFGKHKQIARFVDISAFTPYTRENYQALGGAGTAEVLLLAQPLSYSSLRLRRVLVEVDADFEGATVTVADENAGTEAVLTKNLSIGFNKINLEVDGEPMLINTDTFPLRCSIKIQAEGLGFRPIQSAQLRGLVRRESYQSLLLQTQWELIVDMQKIADEFSGELVDAFWYKCGIIVLGRHLKAQRANNSTIVGREEIQANREELKEEYKNLLCNAVKKIMPALERSPETRNDLRFDMGYSVGSLV